MRPWWRKGADRAISKGRPEGRYAVVGQTRIGGVLHNILRHVTKSRPIQYRKVLTK